MLALTLVAAGSFALGLGRQLLPAGPSPFPRTTLSSLQRPSAVPLATPAPSLQVAEAEPRPARRASSSEIPPDLSAAIPDAAPAQPAAAQAAGTDTAAAAPDPNAPPPAPDPDTPPT